MLCFHQAAASASHGTAAQAGRVRLPAAFSWGAGFLTSAARRPARAPKALLAVASSGLPGEDPHGSGADAAVVGGTGGTVRGGEGGAARHAARTAARGKSGSIRAEAAPRGRGVEAARGGRGGIMRWTQRTLRSVARGP